MDFLNEMIMPLVLAACLVVGYIFKKWMPADNKYIPTVLAVLGAVLGCVSLQEISLQTVVAGAVTGLASTGLHQIFKSFIEREGEDNVL